MTVTFPVRVPAALVPLTAPLPSPRQFDLLAAASIQEPTTNRWLGGAFIGGDMPGPAHTFDPCSSGTQRVKEPSGTPAQSMSGRFSVYITALCTAQSVGPDPTWLTDRLQNIFKVYEGAAVERVLATGDGHTTLGPYLGDPNLEALGGGVVTAVRGLELLEKEISKNGTGMIHAAPATATAWISETLLFPRQGKMYTGLGTPVAVGAGYNDVDPDNEATPAADQEWAFASGPIEIYRDTQIEIVPDRYSAALDRTTNDLTHIAERPYLLNWIARQSSSDDDHIQAGVLIDLVP